MRRNFSKSSAAGYGGLRLALACADEVARAVDRRLPEARALAVWLDREAGRIGLEDGEDFANTVARKPLPALLWRRVRAAITRALRAAPDAAASPGELWLDALCVQLELDALDRRLLAVALYYELDERFEAFIDTVSTARGGQPAAVRLRAPGPAAQCAARRHRGSAVAGGPAARKRPGATRP